MEGGYYRVDLTDELSVLALNTLYFDSERDPKAIDTRPRGKEQLQWLREQLTEDSTRRFILISHVYGGSRYNSWSLWNDEPRDAYFKLLAKHRDRVVIELGGHDHFASLRSHMDDLGMPYHNMFVAPSLTPWYSNNPGVSSFSIAPVSDENPALVPKGLRSTYLDL